MRQPRLGDSLDIEPSLVGQTSIIDGSSDIQLGIRHLKSHVCKHLGRLFDIFRDGSSDEMTLESDTIEWCALDQE